MLILVELMGLLVTVVGIFAIVFPESLRGWIAWWQPGDRLRVGGLLKAILGVVLVAGADVTRWPLPIAVFGGLVVAGGLAAALLGPGSLRRGLLWWQQRSVAVLRVWGAVTAIVGALIVYATR